jgi:6-phosphogluconolactonase (cycloisomerase 2 family)
MRLLLGAVLTALSLLGVSATSAMASHGGALYTQTNDPAGNVVQKFDRASDGTLTAAGTYATGGVGLAGLGGRQGAVELSEDGDTVYAVNAGSNTVTAFDVGRNGLTVVGSVPSGGTAPVSIDERRGRVYVLNSGDTANVTAFRARRDGSLQAFAARELPGALGAAQVSVSPRGGALVVSERLSNRLETLALDRHGRPGAPVITASSGTVPFGFAFDQRGRAIVSEAGASTVSSYRLASDGSLAAITPSLPVGQGAACWVAVSPNGRYAYTGNVSGSISGFAIDRSGALSALDADGLTAVPNLSPRDLDFSRDGRFVYVVSPGNATTGGRVTGYRVGHDGSLTEITSAPAAAGLTGAAAE